MYIKNNSNDATRGKQIAPLKSVHSATVDNSISDSGQNVNTAGGGFPFFRAWFGDYRSADTNPVSIANIEYVNSNETRKENHGNVRNGNTVWIIRTFYEGASHTGKKRLSEFDLNQFRQLKYTENVAELSADALADYTRSGGSTNDNSATDYSIFDVYSFVKISDKEFLLLLSRKQTILGDTG